MTINFTKMDKHLREEEVVLARKNPIEGEDLVRAREDITNLVDLEAEKTTLKIVSQNTTIVDTMNLTEEITMTEISMNLGVIITVGTTKDDESQFLKTSLI